MFRKILFTILCLFMLSGSAYAQTDYYMDLDCAEAGGDGTTGECDGGADDVFITPQPYPSWVLDDNYDWVAPVPYPNDGKCYEWDESIINWVEVPCMPTE